MVEDPTNLQTAEVGSQRQAGLRSESILSALARQGREVLPHPRVLPHQRIRDGLARPAIPNHGSLTLVRDADGRDLLPVDVPLGAGFADHLLRSLPDLTRVMLHPARSRIDLLVFPLRHADRAPGAVKDNEARTGCALIQRSQEVRHSLFTHASYRSQRVPEPTPQIDLPRTAPETPA